MCGKLINVFRRREEKDFDFIAEVKSTMENTDRDRQKERQARQTSEKRSAIQTDK